MNIITTKKIIASAIISIMLMGLVTPIFAATTKEGTVNKKAYIYGKDKKTIIATIYKGQAVKASEEGNWYKVTWSKEAYAHKNFVDENEKAIGVGPNLYSDKNHTNQIGDLKEGQELTILDNKKLYGNYYKVSVNVTGYMNKADLDIKTNTTSSSGSTTSNKPTTSTTSSSGSTTSILASLLQITFKGAETGARLTFKFLSGLLGKLDGNSSSSTTESEYDLVLNPASIEIEKESTATITATFQGKTVKPTYKSKKESVATVDTNGKITGISKGKTKIEATYTDKNKVTHKATCTVTINEKGQAIDNSYVYNYGGNTYKIAVSGDRLDETINIINNKGLIQKNESSPRSHCDEIANYHILMLLGKEDGNKTLDYIMNNYENHGTDVEGTLTNLKRCIDNKKPARLHVNNGNTLHWVTVVGYKNDGKNFSDFLIISTMYGNLINGDSSEAKWKDGTTNAYDGIRTYN